MKQPFDPEVVEVRVQELKARMIEQHFASDRSGELFEGLPPEARTLAKKAITTGFLNALDESERSGRLRDLVVLQMENEALEVENAAQRARIEAGDFSTTPRGVRSLLSRFRNRGSSAFLLAAAVPTMLHGIGTESADAPPTLLSRSANTRAVDADVLSVDAPTAAPPSRSIGISML